MVFSNPTPERELFVANLECSFSSVGSIFIKIYSRGLLIVIKEDKCLHYVNCTTVSGFNDSFYYSYNLSRTVSIFLEVSFVKKESVWHD